MIDKIISKTKLATRIYETSYISGEFTLRSGETSHEYFDKYLFESDPRLLFSIVYHMKLLVPSGIDFVAGLEMGGIPIATMISYQTGIPALFVRKQMKPYGTQKLAEGYEFSGKKVLLVEDVITSGGQVLASSRELKERGANIAKIISVIDREAGGSQKIKEAGYELETLFKISDLRSVI